jgi:hypothetical protein
LACNKWNISLQFYGILQTTRSWENNEREALYRLFHLGVHVMDGVLFIVSKCKVMGLPIVLQARKQGCGSGSGLDPDSIGSVGPDPDSESGSRRAKMTLKSRKVF